MRVCIINATGKLFEAQSGGDIRSLQALTTNAMAAGYLPHEFTVKIINDNEYTELIANEIAPVVPIMISDRQFFQQLAVIGSITQEEALASNAGVIPAPLLALINTMPEEQQFAVKMIVSGSTVFERSHPITLTIGAAYGWTPEQIDTFFIAASQL